MPERPRRDGEHGVQLGERPGGHDDLYDDDGDGSDKDNHFQAKRFDVPYHHNSHCDVQRWMPWL